MRNHNNTKNTFWNRLRSNNGVSLKSISKDLDIDSSTLSHYFTGQKLPSTATSVRICDYFGVDYAVGASEFNKAHEEWIAENPGAKKKRSHIRSRKYDVKNIPETTSKPQVTEVPEPVTEHNEKDTILTESTIFSMKRDSILRLLYNKVDYDVYNKVANIFDS